MGVGVDEIIKSIKKFQNHRHMLNTDLGGGGVRYGGGGGG